MTERFHNLKGSCDALFANHVGRKAHDVLAFESYGALIRMEKACDEMEQGRLPGTVWSDESKDLIPHHLEGDIGNRFQAAKGLGHRLDFEKGPVLHL
jgi:hypothetical protein